MALSRADSQKLQAPKKKSMTQLVTTMLPSREESFDLVYKGVRPMDSLRRSGAYSVIISKMHLADISDLTK